MGNQRLRVGAVSYLNTKPLVYGLADQAPGMELVYDVPSRLADGLQTGQLDVALIPSISYITHDHYQIVSDACIACRGPVLSVKLFSRVPLEQIRTIAMDEGSRTSVALVRILLREHFGIQPASRPLPLGCSPESTDTDAVLLIGDRAIRGTERRFAVEWDLGDTWWRWTGKPFVFAMWTARAELEADGLAAVLSEARERGVRHLDKIAAKWAEPSGLTISRCLEYLRDNLHFYLGPDERAGLDLFARLAAPFPPENNRAASRQPTERMTRD